MLLILNYCTTYRVFQKDEPNFKAVYFTIGSISLKHPIYRWDQIVHYILVCMIFVPSNMPPAAILDFGSTSWVTYYYYFMLGIKNIGPAGPHSASWGNTASVVHVNHQLSCLATNKLSCLQIGCGTGKKMPYFCQITISVELNQKSTCIM